MFHFGRAELLATTVAALVILTRIGLTIPLHPASVLRVGGTIPVASGGRVLTLAALCVNRGNTKKFRLPIDPRGSGLPTANGRLPCRSPVRAGHRKARQQGLEGTGLPRSRLWISRAAAARRLEHSVEKLQEMIDAAFGKQAERTPQRASEGLIERERVLGEQARKIEALRQARLHDDGAKRSPVSLVFEVVRHRGHWRMLHRTRHSTPFSDQAAAILAAKKVAKRKQELGHSVEVRLVRTDGQVVVQSLDNEHSE